MCAISHAQTDLPPGYPTSLTVALAGSGTALDQTYHLTWDSAIASYTATPTGGALFAVTPDDSTDLTGTWGYQGLDPAANSGDGVLLQGDGLAWDGSAAGLEADLAAGEWLDALTSTPYGPGSSATFTVTVPESNAAAPASLVMALGLQRRQCRKLHHAGGF
jgi:hypothetical protein